MVLWLSVPATSVAVLTSTDSSTNGKTTVITNQWFGMNGWQCKFVRVVKHTL
jgi:hypothetical protein